MTLVHFLNALKILAQLPPSPQKDIAINRLLNNGDLETVGIPHGKYEFHDVIEDGHRTRIFFCEDQDDGAFILLIIVTEGKVEEFSSIDNLEGNGPCSWEMEVPQQ